jgi:hypothetical protein
VSALVILAAAGAFVGSALGDAIVSAAGSPPNVTITVTHKTGVPDPGYGLRVEPFNDSSRSGIRIGQLQFGNPAITSGTSNCFANFVFNDVVCSPGPFGKITIQTGAGPDVVELDNCRHDGCIVGSSPGAGNCTPDVTTVFPSVPVTAQLGGGEDDLTVVAFATDPCPGGSGSPAGTFTQDVVFDPILTVDGGPGNDALTGGPLDDHLDGGMNDDTLNGGDGNDVLIGGEGHDTINGDGGDDVYQVSDRDGPDGPDTFSGGPGFDTIDYSVRICSLTITIGNGQADDGCPGEGDNVMDADKLIGSLNGDDLTGSSAPETILGGGGNDTIRGGPGADVLHGDSGNDTIDALDGEQDTVACGSNTDTAVLDLKDKLVLLGRSKITPGFSDCESITRAAVDDSPPGRPLRRPVQLTSAGAAVDFRCPPTSRPACHGRLFVYAFDRRGRALGSVAYSLRLGTTAVVRVPLTRRALSELHAGHRADVRTIEHGHSTLGPRSADFELRTSG